MNFPYKLIVPLALFVNLSCSAQVKQQAIPRVDQMPNVPQPFEIIDYNKLAHDFDKTIFDFNQKGQFWPMVWMDTSRKNFDQDVVGMYTAVGDVRQGPNVNNGMFHESLATMGATLGATLVGIDKTKQGNLNYVAMLKNYFSKDTGWNIMMNNTTPKVALLGGGYGRDWWYDVFPNVMFYAIYDKYPNEPGLEEMARSIADKFYEADKILAGNYDYSYFDYGNMKPMKNNICAQPDASAGHAWVLYAAYKKFGDKKYLDGTISALKALQSQQTNPTYELLMPFGASIAARVNAEQGQNFDVNKMLHWTFDGTPICREGWGVLVGNWNGYDISGTVGSTVDRGGYGFLMNTYDMAWPMVPMVRYDQSYATAIGKWMLNAANASKFFYPEHMADEHETIPTLASAGKGVIAYEGIIKKSNMKEYESVQAPVAQGDGPLWVPGQNPPQSQLSVYGSGHVGIFGSIIKKTNVDNILQLDLLATDFFRDKAYPTYLYYNPSAEAKSVTINTDSDKSKKVDLYDMVSGKFIAKNVDANSKVTVPANGSAVIVLVPANGKVAYSGTKMSVNGVVVDYHAKGK
ncbi:hypothetical protein [Flavobacterium silvaticum]|uniref:D-glucuronyl C5-epimerase C-terminal domain-containing protein n=1 Tax=Flavobacterium silvaticum TaxID=1852020 RepID=A0A972FJ32_9FLAO|nr:hypothetical protein [Flavobacterium silvaticum]NMH26896.1 hypothetical protein [Flavobacterium silvaticum]